MFFESLLGFFVRSGGSSDDGGIGFCKFGCDEIDLFEVDVFLFGSDSMVNLGVEV